MAEIKIVYEGLFTNRRSEKLRQTRIAIGTLREVGCPINLDEGMANEHHEMAHVVGHDPGRVGRMRAYVLISARNKILGWGVEHDMTLEEKMKMRPGEQTRASLAPARIKNKPVTSLNVVDVFTASLGVLSSGITGYLERKHGNIK